MRKKILSVLFFAVLLTACQTKSDKQNNAETENTPGINSESGNDQSDSSSKKPGAREYLYKSDNGEIIEVTFFEENYEKFIEVKREGQPGLVLEQIIASENMAVYQKNISKWISRNGTATFTNGINFLTLTLISPLKYTYTNDLEDITIIYFTKNDKRFVTIQRINQPEITLEQTTAWAAGAEYGRGPVQWHTQKNTGTLIENGLEIEFKEKL